MKGRFHFRMGVQTEYDDNIFQYSRESRKQFDPISQNMEASVALMISQWPSRLDSIIVLLSYQDPD